MVFGVFMWVGGSFIVICGLVIVYSIFSFLCGRMIDFFKGRRLG